MEKLNTNSKYLVLYDIDEVGNLEPKLSEAGLDAVCLGISCLPGRIQFYELEGYKVTGDPLSGVSECSN